MEIQHQARHDSVRRAALLVRTRVQDTLLKHFEISDLVDAIDWYRAKNCLVISTSFPGAQLHEGPTTSLDATKQHRYSWNTLMGYWDIMVNHRKTIRKW